MRLIRSRRLLAVGLVFSMLCVVSCSDVQEPECDLWESSAIVRGHARTGSGNPVPGVTLQVRVGSGRPCDDPDSYDWGRSVTTDANGVYGLTLKLGNQTGIRCIMVIDEATGSMTHGQVEFVGGCDNYDPPQELSLDLVVQ